MSGPDVGTAAEVPPCVAAYAALRPRGLAAGCRHGYFPGVNAPSDYAPKLDRLSDNCPVRAALDVVRGRWKPSILFELRSRARRFSELQTALPGITAQTLTLQLRQLEADGVVCRTVHPEIPPRVEYALSEFGATLSGVMDQLETWGISYLARRNQRKPRRL